MKSYLENNTTVRLQGSQEPFILTRALEENLVSACSAVYSYLNERALMVVTTGTTCRNRWAIRRNTAPISFFPPELLANPQTQTSASAAPFKLREMLRQQIHPIPPLLQVSSHMQRPCWLPRWTSLIWCFPPGSASLTPHLSPNNACLFPQDTIRQGSENIFVCVCVCKNALRILYIYFFFYNILHN